jgi:hypothetical protein
MNKQRLLTLATELEKPAMPIPFDMSNWYSRPYILEEELDEHPGMAPLEAAHNCGTSACAVGLACLMPEFQKQGLTTNGGMPVFNGAQNWAAVCHFFDVSEYTARHLFDPEDYLDGVGIDDDSDFEKITPQMVATRIREVVAKNDRDTDDLASEFPDL